jgi:hypothetical protein
MKLIISAVATVVLLGCGSDKGIFSLSTGTYGLSNVAAVATDDCNIASVFGAPNTSIQVAVSASSATFQFGSDPSHAPVAGIDGNTINQGSKTFDVDDRPAIDCQETITETVSGDLMANDQVEGTLKYVTTQKTGTTGACPAQAMGYKVFPCASTMTFHAQKK